MNTFARHNSAPLFVRREKMRKKLHSWELISCLPVLENIIEFIVMAEKIKFSYTNINTNNDD